MFECACAVRHSHILSRPAGVFSGTGTATRQRFTVVDQSVSVALSGSSVRSAIVPGVIRWKRRNFRYSEFVDFAAFEFIFFGMVLFVYRCYFLRWHY